MERKKQIREIFISSLSIEKIRDNFLVYCDVVVVVDVVDVVVVVVVVFPSVSWLVGWLVGGGGLTKIIFLK